MDYEEMETEEFARTESSISSDKENSFEQTQNSMQSSYAELKSSLSLSRDATSREQLSETVASLRMIPKLVDQTQHITVKEQPQFYATESSELRDTADKVAEKLFGAGGGSINTDIDFVSQMILSSIGRNNGDELTEDDFDELSNVFGEPDYVVEPILTNSCTITIEDELPHGLTQELFNKLRRKLNLNYGDANQRRETHRKISSMSHSEVMELLGSRKRGHGDDSGTKQNVNENKSNDAVVNPDEGEQKRILRIIYDNWTVDTEDPKGLKIPEDPLSYWTTLISDDYAETVENIFYFSFLCKQSIVKVWYSEDFQENVFVPDFDAIDKSKLGKKAQQASRHKRTIYSYMDPPQQIRDASRKLIEEKLAQDKKLEKANEAHLRKNNKNHPLMDASRQGVVSLTRRQWSKILEIFKKDPEWTKHIATRPKQP